MDVANLSLCKELYAVSGWDDTDYWWHEWSYHPRWEVVKPLIPAEDDVAAYDLGYLLRKLPYCQITRFSSDKYKAVWTGDDKMLVGRSTTSAENAMARLCIELFKQNILQPSVTNEEIS